MDARLGPQPGASPDPATPDPATPDPANLDPADLDPADLDPADLDPADLDPADLDPTASDPSAPPRTPTWPAGWALAAGTVGLLANALLVAFYALELDRGPVGPVSLGTANDVVGSVGAALMVPVAVAFGPGWLRALGGASTAVLVVAGPLLVSGALTFAQQLPVALLGALGLAGWLVLVGRQLPGGVPAGVARLGRFAGGGVLVGMPIVGAGLLLPQLSWGQLALFGLGGLPGVAAWLATPFWFLRLGRVLRRRPAARRRPAGQ